MSRGPTPSQTIGPFFHDALLREDGSTPEVDPEASEATIVLEGRVLDAKGVGVDDALVELWRPDPARTDPTGDGLGWARSRTDRDGRYRLTTGRPTPLPHASGHEQAPHLVLLVFARGLLDQLLTRAYPVDSDEVPRDPVLDRVPTGRRTTLVARRDGDVDGRPRYRFDLRLQGDGETVFFGV